jgi:ADP-L-glycero-D-manno-heptose 6-epimerase
MIVVTGAAGFIGSALVSALLKQGYGEIVAVDDFSDKLQMQNLEAKKIKKLVHRDDFFDWINECGDEVQFIFHMGARTNTAEFSEDLLRSMNLEYSKKVWESCVRYSIPLIYASSAATYGDGGLGFDDNVLALKSLKPLNPYGWSKHNFDIWVQEQADKPPFWAGFKFFNVFGPNEWHKGRMASVVYHSYNQIKENGMVKLFRSHHPAYEDGMQLRDFVYVLDVVKVLIWFMENRRYSDLYNLGTGKARSFKDLALAVFAALGKSPQIEYTDIPEDIRGKYQYYTCANMQKVFNAGYPSSFMELENSVKDYINNYLQNLEYY